MYPKDKHIELYKCYFPPNIVSLRPSFCPRTDRQFRLHQPFARTNAFHSSFVPNATNLWNTLSERLVTSPFSVSKANVLHIYNYFMYSLTILDTNHVQSYTMCTYWIVAFWTPCREGTLAILSRSW